MAGVGIDDFTGESRIHQGYTYRIRYTFPADVDLTGATAVWQVRRNKGAADPPFVNLSTALGTITIDQDDDDLWYAEGLFAAPVTGAMDGTYKKMAHELRITQSGEKPWGIKGKFDLDPEVIPS